MRPQQARKSHRLPNSNNFTGNIPPEIGNLTSTEGCGLVVNKVVESHEISGLNSYRDKKTRGDFSHLS